MTGSQVRTLRDVEPLIAEQHSGAHDGATCAAAVAQHLKESYRCGRAAAGGCMWGYLCRLKSCPGMACRAVL